MKHKATNVLAVLAVFSMACLPFLSCSHEEDETHGFDSIESPYEITDSILVIFGNEQWSTLDYTSKYVHDSIYDYDWVYVDAHYPGKTYPRVRMKFFQGKGTHSAAAVINDLGLGYTVPGLMTGDPLCGDIFYYEKTTVHSPDGTLTSDWWPMEITMEILDFNESDSLATAYIHGTLFDYASWVSREVTNVEDCEMREFTITFGDLPVGTE